VPVSDTSFFQSHYMPNTPSQQQEMLDSIGINSIDDLFSDIPTEHRHPTLDIPHPISEIDLKSELMTLGIQNRNLEQNACFLGAGAYNHFSPSIVKAILTRGEFLTSYTPYQAEASQGTLQVAYEFQSLISNLMSMDVANDGMYDGATSFAEAALMACRVTKRDEIYVLDTINPVYREVIETYASPQKLKIHTLSSSNPRLPQTASCLLVQYPNFHGTIEDLSLYKRQTEDMGSLLVVSANPIAMGILKPPGEFGADIVTGEGQALGIPISYGGPYVGLFCTRKKFVRQMPGRIVGRTNDSDGKTGYVLTLQTREQHIRREKATSNICTSQALLALAATITMAAVGKTGFRQQSELSYHKAHYTASLIQNIPGFSLPIQGDFFNEFVVKCPINPSKINKQLLANGIIGGLDISSSMPNCMLIAVTEMNTASQITALAETLKKFGS
jgi:glycine dehydrogenase subunit 1